METLNIGFLGTGWIASVYAAALRNLHGVRIAALCNHHVEKAQAFNTKHVGGTAACYADFEQMLAAESLQALFVCIPPGMHNGEAEAAAARGIHLMLEKPIALTQQRADSIAAAVNNAGVVCQIGHHMRHTAPSLKLKRMIEDGSAGRPLMMQGRFFVSSLFPAWWRDPQRGGGQLIEQSIHMYDLARYFLGDVQTVVGFVDSLAHGRFADYRVDDVSAATVRFRNGAVASLCASNCADPSSGSITATVLCERVMVEFRSPDDATFGYHDGKASEELLAANPLLREAVKTGDVSAYHELTRNFVAAIRGAESARSSIADGVEGLRTVLSVAQSSQHGGAPQQL